MATETTTLYRYRDPVIGAHEHEPVLEEYIVVRETAKCYYVKIAGYYQRKPKRMIKHAFRRFAWPTVRKAQQSHLARKRRQFHVTRSQSRNALWFFRQANEAWGMNEEDPEDYV